MPISCKGKRKKKHALARDFCQKIWRYGNNVVTLQRSKHLGLIETMRLTYLNKIESREKKEKK